MSFEQVEERDRLILENAIKWANSRECNPLDITDILALGKYLNVSIPKSFSKFRCSENPNQARVCGCEKIIFRTLNNLKNELLNYEQEEKIKKYNLEIK